MIFKLDGNEYELLLPDDMSMGVQREFEKIAGQGIQGIIDLPERWSATVMVAWMAVSIKKARPDQQMHEIVSRLDDVMPAELQEAWSSVERQNPPQTSTSDESAEGAPPSSAASSQPSEPSPEPSTPSDTGTPPSAITTISDRKTSTV